MRLVFALFIGFLSLSASAKTKFISIGTGGVTGVFYPTGNAIAKVVNARKKKHGIRVSVESTPGSVYNVNSVLSGNLDYGIVQSDRQYQAVHGMAEWEKKGKQKGLRAILSLHAESVTLVASQESGIKSLEDLKGKRVSIGNPGSGPRGNALDILGTAQIDWKKDFKAEALKADEAPKMLQDGRIDAFFYTVGHPSGAITEATSGRRKVRFVPIEGMDKLLAKYPYYVKSSVPIRAYPKALNKKDIPSIGGKGTFVTSATASEDVVYTITKLIFENLDEFKKLHPALSGLTKKNMLEGLSAPLHPGAKKYYKEKGLL